MQHTPFTMAVLHTYDYIFYITAIFAFLDAWNIGANDVANSFASSVSSRSLTLKQAMLIASVMEFTGSTAVGSRVADTIRTKLIDPHQFDGSPQVLLLAMMCTIISSSVFLTIATRYGMPISTTHAVVGGLIGTATASIGIGKVTWGWHGVTQIFVAWLVCPIISGCFGAILFFLTKRLVLVKPSAVKRAFYSIPFYSFLTIGSIISKSYASTATDHANCFSVVGMERCSWSGALWPYACRYYSCCCGRRCSFTQLDCHALSLGPNYARRLDTAMVSCFSGSIPFATPSAAPDSPGIFKGTD